MLSVIKKMDRKTKIYLGMALGILLFMILLIVILKMSVGSKIDSKTFETRLKNAATSYYKKHDKELPKENGEKTHISIDTLVDKGYLKNPKKLLKNNATCNGGVNVNNNNGYYLYQAVIECSDGYKTNLFKYYKTLHNPLP